LDVKKQHVKADQPIILTPDNLATITSSYPTAVRQALRFALPLEKGTLTIGLPGPQTLKIVGSQPGPHASMIVNDLRFATRLANGGDVGIAEAYLRGEWDTPDLTRFLELFCVNHPVIQRMLEGRPFVRLFQLFQHWMNRNTKSGARRNIHAHYDLGNHFYSAWLDRTMTYSAAIFDGGDNDLSSAQLRKYRQLAAKTGIRPEHHVLEIGCGWGGFAEFSAREIGCRVTALTISNEQYHFAKARIAQAGLADRVAIKLQDYRDEAGLYDRIISIEMFEAVGEQYWPVYFRQLSQRLKAGGLAGLQVITISDNLWAGYKRELDFIRRYVFPGGMLPTPRILNELGAQNGLALATERIFGHDYAATLVQWRDRFRAAWPDLIRHGFDERFRRLWEYYLAYCEAGFRVGNIDVRHMVFAKRKPA
jgi:cyclopropane-fatty-acyl-phospholipid synthase